jgi:hypothetical protein
MNYRFSCRCPIAEAAEVNQAARQLLDSRLRLGPRVSLPLRVQKRRLDHHVAWF